MLTRKSQSKSPILLPKQWCEKVENLLISIYSKDYDSEQMTFEVHAMTYPDEVLLTASFIHKNEQGEAPVTYQVSTDLEKETASEKIIQILVDSIGIYFDDYFQSAQSSSEDDEESAYIPRWQETVFKNQKIYYRVTRENIGLTLLADQLLAKED